ncbi:Lysophosphatidic acid phosphatase type 6 [Mortierella sp. AD094]|nr:Lysophosphatidic acid phosphatase type 6 [Mortierella sp. AD094]
MFMNNPVGAEDRETHLNYTTIAANQVVTLPTDSPYSEHMWKGNCILGQLTPLGAQQHQRLGQDLREIYVDFLKFLPETFDPATLRIRSTDVRRTKQSAENLMIGMYGTNTQTLGLSPSVFQIHTLPSEIDYMTMKTDRCPRIRQLSDNIKKSSEVLEQLQDSQRKFREDTNNLISTQHNYDFTDLVDAILPRICHSFPLQCDPNNQTRCITQEIADRCVTYASLVNAETNRDAKGVQEMLQLGIGPLTRDILKNIMDAKEDKSDTFLLFLGHDTTLSPLLGMLDSADMRWPPYCDLEWCPLDKFVEHLNEFVVDNLTAKCKTKKKHRTK